MPRKSETRTMAVVCRIVKHSTDYLCTGKVRPSYLLLKDLRLGGRACRLRSKDIL